MRDILFRGKRKDNDKWVYGDLKQFKEKGKLLATIIAKQSYVAENFLVISETVGQYMGKTDKNKERIFEGDILRYRDKNFKVVFEQRYGRAYFGIAFSPTLTIAFDDYIDLKYAEVVGNIYDNPKQWEYL